MFKAEEEDSDVSAVAFPLDALTRNLNTKYMAEEEEEYEVPSAMHYSPRPSTSHTTTPPQYTP